MAAQLAPELVRGAFLEDPPLYWGERDAHANDVEHFQDLLSRAQGWQAAGVSEADAIAELAAEPDGDAQTADALAARAYSLLHLDVPTWPAEACPLCAKGGTPVKPGSR